MFKQYHIILFWIGFILCIIIVLHCNLRQHVTCWFNGCNLMSYSYIIDCNKAMGHSTPGGISPPLSLSINFVLLFSLPLSSNFILSLSLSLSLSPLSFFFSLFHSSLSFSPFTLSLSHSTSLSSLLHSFYLQNFLFSRSLFLSFPLSLHFTLSSLSLPLFYVSLSFYPFSFPLLSFSLNCLFLLSLLHYFSCPHLSISIFLHTHTHTHTHTAIKIMLSLYVPWGNCLHSYPLLSPLSLHIFLFSSSFFHQWYF